VTDFKIQFLSAICFDISDEGRVYAQSIRSLVSVTDLAMATLD